MPELFGIDIAGIVADAMADGLLDATLIRMTYGNRTPGDITAGQAETETSYAAKGFIDDYADNLKDGELIKQGDRKITLLGKSIAGLVVPQQYDKITIEGTTYLIVGPVKRDPAAATYECQARA